MPEIAGWTITQVLFEQGDLRRYAVRRAADGRTGILDIAAVGTAAAAGLWQHAIGLPPHTTLDRGVDPYGNPYFVIPSFEPAGAPQVVPRILAAPPARGDKRIVAGVVIGVGVLVAIGVVNALVNREKKPRPPPLTATAQGAWGDRCSDPFLVAVKTRPDVAVDVLGHHAKADILGKAEIEIAPAELAGRKTVPVHLADGGEVFDVEVTVPAAPDLPLFDGKVHSDSMSIYQATATLGDRKVALENKFGEKAGLPPDRVRFVWQVCGVTVGTQAAGTTATVVGNTLTVEVDLGERVWKAAGAEPPKGFVIPVALLDAAQTPLTLNIDTGEVSLGRDSQIWKRLEQPLPDAPLPADAPRPRAIAILEEGRLDRSHLGAAAPGQAPYVARRAYKSTSVSSCGPYGYQHVYADRTRATVDVQLFETRTGRLVAKKSFTGSIPSCPSGIMTYEGKADSVYGSVPSEAIDRWLGGFSGQP